MSDAAGGKSALSELQGEAIPGVVSIARCSSCPSLSQAYRCLCR